MYLSAAQPSSSSFIIILLPYNLLHNLGNHDKRQVFISTITMGFIEVQKSHNFDQKYSFGI